MSKIKPGLIANLQPSKNYENDYVIILTTYESHNAVSYVCVVMRLSNFTKFTTLIDERMLVNVKSDIV
jgi:hypothetical protein